MSREPDNHEEPPSSGSAWRKSAAGHRAFDGQVLSTLNADGSRRKMQPQLSQGRFLRRRQFVGWALVALFVGLPFIEIAGKPSILLDLVARRFTFFGLTLLPSDTLLLMLFMLAAFFTIFLVTALFGRVWCGWGCPQTVYMELLFRPLERWLEGGRTGSIRMDRGQWSWRRWVKFGVFAAISFALANVFLSYFVGVKTLGTWMTQSPFEHPTPFLVMAVTAGLIFFDFAYFREQMCTVVCPYARLQSVLVDRKSLIIGYDEARGEPRGKAAKVGATETVVAKSTEKGTAKGNEKLGDCVACNACVTTCPTGIDIRGGLQLECIGCAQCIDACDNIMDKLGRQRGLIRYSSQDALAGNPSRILRPRVLVYPALITIAVVALFAAIPDKTQAEAWVLRGLGAPFTVDAEGWITNTIRVKVANRDDIEHSYTIELVGLDGARLVAPINPFPVKPGAIEQQGIFVSMPPGSVPVSGSLPFKVKLSDGHGYIEEIQYRFVGPTAGSAAVPTAGSAPSTGSAINEETEG